MPASTAVRTAVIACATLSIAAAGTAAAQGVAGRVVASGQPVSGAVIEVEGALPAVMADSAGRFRVALSAGAHVLVVSALGHEPARRRVEVGAGGWTAVEVELRVSVVALDALVVTGLMRETRVSESAAKVDVVSGRQLQRTVSSSLMETIGQVNGLYAQIDCGVCYTNSIRINGMEGPYTAVLIDGMPIMGGLASVYGLNGIDPALVEQLEILKGPASTLYGTEAMGGVVNVITKSPRFSPRFAVDVNRSGARETNANAAASFDGERLDGLLSASVTRADGRLDGNADGFTDSPLVDRVAVFGKLEWRRGVRRPGMLTAKLYREERFGGQLGWTREDRGSSHVYGEWVRTRRGELMATVRPPGLESLSADLSMSLHEQESWYGDVRYDARQAIAWSQLTWRTDVAGHDVLAGAALRWQLYDDGTPATAAAERRTIPGVFVQDEFDVGRSVTVVGGIRLDHHGEHGGIVSPRLNVLWRPMSETQVRLNAGTGFRVVNLFTEDHAALTGAREVVIADALRPERSRSIAVNVNRIIDFGVNPMMIDLDLFHTRFTNRIVPDYDVDPDLIVYDNLRGHSVSRGLAFAMNQNFATLPLRYTVGLTIQDVRVTRDGEERDEVHSPSWKGAIGLSWAFARPRITLDWTGTLVGPMRLPAYDAPWERATRSPAHSVHNLRAGLSLPHGVEVYAAANNLFDFTQGSPLVDPGNPFGDAFDTTWVWGPIRGRQLIIGARWGVSR